MVYDDFIPNKQNLFYFSLPPQSREKIIALLSQDNSLSAAALAERIGTTQKAVEKHIAKMKAEGILKRVGPDKGGHWQVAEKASE